MRIPAFFGLAVIACSSLGAANTLKPRNFETHDYFTLHLRSGESPTLVARALGLTLEGPVGELRNHFYFSAKRGEHQAEEKLDWVTRRTKKRDILGDGLDGILWSRKQKLKPRMQKRNALPPLPARAAPAIPGAEEAAGPDVAAIAQRQQVQTVLGIQDPIFGEQWHLFNTVELGHDVNISSVWVGGNTGQNATVAVIDDGLDMYSDDLKDNYFAKGSYDFNDHTDEPRPRLSDDHHGTRCAGEIAAVKNNVCGVGVAYDSKVAGLRILSGQISDEDEAVAINYAMQENQIYSCSWGPPDDGRSMDAPDTLIKSALMNGVQNGRGGLGSIFVFAAGNGAASEDNCNFDGYTNSIYSITVGAIDRKGGHPYYSEKCSAGLVVTYSSGAGDAIHTTDIGTNNCYSNHGGTSAAAPLAAGIFALVLSIRPDLSWRDLQYLCVETAVPVDTVDDWQDTYIGKKYSHTFSYGKLDAYALVEKAKTWKSVKPQAWFKSPWQHVKHAIPQGNQGLVSSFEVTKEMLEKANLERLEQMTVTMNVEHTRRGDISVELISPHGIKSHLSATRRNDENPVGYVDWTFMSVVHWGEPGVGNWTIIVKDTVVNDYSGNFTDWRMMLWGEARDASKAKPYPMPTEHDDDDHDVENGKVSTISVVVPGTSTLPPTPSDHPNRPVNNKPGSDKPVPVHDKPVITAPISSTGSATTPTAPPATTAASDTTVTPTSTFFLPSIFPTFGVSPRTQIWIYGAIGTILIFAIALGGFFLVQRRRRAPKYESLEMFEGRDGAGASEPLGGRQRRAGELYDAFAGESDEELFSGDESHDEGYRDEFEEKKRGSRSRSVSPVNNKST